MNWTLKREVFPLTILIILVCVTAHYYQGLPDPMPTHFDAKGSVNGWTGKNAFIVQNLGVMFGMYFLITFLPFIDPLRKKIEAKYDQMLIYRDIFIGFWAFLYGLLILAAFEGTLRSNFFGIGIGLLFILVGNYLPKLPRNWFIGIQTPWTMSSEAIWKKTHIVGGWLFAVSGLVIIVLSLLKVSLIVTSFIILPVILTSCLLYPLYLFKKLQKTNDL